jgi:ABC-type dipeptide/oligopeptide/nickel transport system permease component
MALVVLGQSIPTFSLGILMILVFAVTWRWLPVSGRASPVHLLMPALVLAIWLASLVARLTRSEVLEILGQDYVRTARAKGLRERTLLTTHVLRNALLPVVAVVGIQFGTLLGGAVVTETVFAWPGIGTLVLESVLRKDYPVVIAALVIVAASLIVISMGLDLVYAYLDPRLRRSQE